MAEDREVMVEASLQAMADAFKKAQETLNNTKSSMTKVAQQMNQGALQGKGGTAFEDAIKNKLNKKLDRLMAKMTEESKDVTDAIARIHAAEKSAAKPFGS
jgi:uncharacterized protein YukE